MFLELYKVLLSFEYDPGPFDFPFLFHTEWLSF